MYRQSLSGYRLVSIVVAVLLMLGSSSLGVSAQSQVPENKFKSIVLASLGAQLDALTNTQKSAAATQIEKIEPAQFAAATQRLIEDNSNRRAFLMKGGIWYSDYQVSFDVVSTTVGKKSASVRGIEHTSLTIATEPRDPLAPPTYDYDLEHEFTFVLDGKGWVLTANRALNPFGPSSSVDAKEQAPILITDEPVAEGRDMGRDSKVLPANINRSSVVNYALTYWQNYNSNYRNFGGNGQGGDCTNFASQAMAAGSWAQTGGAAWDYPSTNEWWYRFYGQTYSWVNVNYFYSFMRNRGRGYTALSFIANFSPFGSFFAPVSTGDLLQFDSNRDGSYDHNMIITSKDSRGYIYLTYHSSNTRNRPVLDLLYATSNYGYRAIKVY